MKKGFTLVELLGTITLLGLLMLVAYPAIMNQIEKKQNEVDDAKMKLIESGTEDYLTSHQNTYPYRVGNAYCILLSDIVEENKIAVDISDVKQKGIQVVMGDHYQYSYHLVDTCPTS